MHSHLPFQQAPGTGQAASWSRQYQSPFIKGMWGLGEHPPHLDQNTKVLRGPAPSLPSWGGLMATNACSEEPAGEWEL